MIKKEPFPYTILQAILLIIGGMVILTPLVFLQKPLQQFISAASFNIVLGTIGILSIWGLACFINWRKGNKISYSFELPHKSLLLLSVFIIIAFQIGIGNQLGIGIRILLDMSNKIENPAHYLTIYLVSIILIAPVLEELIFRGTILKGFLTHYSLPKAIGYSTILFGLAHGTPPLIAGALLTGLFFSWIYYKTRSVGITIILHITANTVALFAGYLRFQLANNSEWLNLYGKYTLFITIVCSIVCIILLARVLKNTEKEIYLIRE